LARRIIEHTTKADDIVLDPFVGTGTFVLSATRLGRKGYGCDIDKKMLQIAQKRGCIWEKQLYDRS